MEKKCNSCGTKENISKITMSSADWQLNEQRHERREKRLVLVIVLLIVLLVGSNLAWTIYENQFEDVTTTTEENITVDAEDNGVANYIGNDGDIYNGENNDKKEENNTNP